MEKQVAPMEIVDLEDDDISLVTPLSCRGSTKKNAISVERYTEDRDLYISIMASLCTSASPHPVISLDDDDDDDADVRVLDIKPAASSFLVGRHGDPCVVEVGQSSNSNSNSNPTFMCEICVEPKSVKAEAFNIEGCTHFYCRDCMIKYVASKLQENVTSIRCPVSNCTGLLEPEYCREILPPEVFERWGSALCESVILGSEKFYCPFKDCSALLINDAQEVVTQSECPNCWRLFCAQCKVPWHQDIDCGEYQKLNKDEREREDIMMMKLAKNRNWKRCPKCKFYVEKSSGCMYMKCRCGFAFCYNCGSPSTSHSHLCSNCKH